jgi:GT2 family glycosyltransferase
MKDVLFILVIYRKSLFDSTAYQSLKNLLNEDILSDCLYVHDNTHDNQYLASAYNQGANVARERGKEWIILLDDDSNITEDYLNKLQEYISDKKHQVVAPILTHKSKKISPTSKYGITVVFNSGMAIRLNTLQQIGGFCTRYPLDYLDYYTCWQLHKHNIPITIMDVVLPHQLSIEDYNQVTLKRYTSILHAEKQFAYDTEHLLEYRLQIIARAIKWLITGHKFSWKTIKYLLNKD